MVRRGQSDAWIGVNGLRNGRYDDRPDDWASGELQKLQRLRLSPLEGKDAGKTGSDLLQSQLSKPAAT